jgi:hypothetical protein
MRLRLRAPRLVHNHAMPLMDVSQFSQGGEVVRGHFEDVLELGGGLIGALERQQRPPERDSG